MTKSSVVLVFFFAVATVTSIKPTTLAPCSIPEPTNYVPLPCGTFVAYSIDQSNLVIEHGFAAGKFRDGSENYVGHAMNVPCKDESNCPARLKVTGDGQGAFMACTNMHHDTVGMRFLLNHPDLKWIETSSNNLNHVPNLVKVRGVFPFFIGRKNLTKTDGTPFSLVSKVYAYNKMAYSFGTGHTYIPTGGFEILSC